MEGKGKGGRMPPSMDPRYAPHKRNEGEKRDGKGGEGVRRGGGLGILRTAFEGARRPCRQLSKPS